MTKLLTLIVLFSLPTFAQAKSDLEVRLERVEKVLSFIAPKQAYVCKHKDKTSGVAIEGIGVSRTEAKTRMLEDCESKKLAACSGFYSWGGTINVMEANGNQLEAAGISCKDVPLESLFE